MLRSFFEMDLGAIAKLYGLEKRESERLKV